MRRKRQRKASNPYQIPTPKPVPRIHMSTSTSNVIIFASISLILAVARSCSLSSLPPLRREAVEAATLTTSNPKQRKERHTVEAPVLQDMGETDDGSTKIQLTSSIPHEMTFTMQQDNAEKKGAILKPCPDCEIYTGNVPEDACDRGTQDLFSVAPGEHRIRGSWTNANISDIAATWKLKPGRKYSLCLVLDTTRGKSDWDHQ